MKEGKGEGRGGEGKGGRRDDRKVEGRLLEMPKGIRG